MRETAQVCVFVGKGGAGKTTCAAATALHYAERAETTLALSTDATPSLSAVFGLSSPQRQRRISDHLTITELGMREVRALWDARFGPEVYAIFSSFVNAPYPVFLDFMTSLLPGLREEFLVDYVRELALTGRYQHIVWDTAPLGQTLTLLRMPTLLARHLRSAPPVYSQVRNTAVQRSIMDILESWSGLAEACQQFLREHTQFLLVTIPEALALEQLEPVCLELLQHRFQLSGLIINNTVREHDSAFLQRKAELQAPHLQRLRARFHQQTIVEVPLLARDLRGLAALHDVAGFLKPALPALATS